MLLVLFGPIRYDRSNKLTYNTHMCKLHLLLNYRVAYRGVCYEDDSSP